MAGSADEALLLVALDGDHLVIVDEVDGVLVDGATGEELELERIVLLGLDVVAA